MERVVVTGLGLVTPMGIGNEPTWEALLEGKSGIAPITLFDASAFATRIAGEVKDFDPVLFMPRKKLKECGRFITLSLAATKLAIEDAGLDLTEEEKDTTGCFIGVGLGGLERIERVHSVMLERGPGKISPYFIPSLIGNLAAGQVSIAHELRGPSMCHTSACSSSAHAMGEAYEWIRHGRADVMVAGGAEATITAVGIGGFSAMFALSRRNDDPERASRPFDTARDGFVCSEGAGTLILESLTRARARGANILGEVTGYGAASDAHHITKPGGGGAVRCMRMALADAELRPDQIGYANAHGTSTAAGDVNETRAMREAFGDHAKDGLWVSSTKSMMGHLLGAAGAVEAGVSLLALRDGKIPPTINLDDQDPECDLDYVANQGRERKLEHVMSNSFGFGGTNATLVLSKFNG